MAVDVKNNNYYSDTVVKKYHERGVNYIRFKQELIYYLIFNYIKRHNRTNFRILDIGAGGGISFYIRNKLNLSNPLWAVEPTDEMFNHLLRNVKRKRFDSIVKMSGDEVPKNLYNNAGLITMISVGGAVKKINKANWEEVWFKLLINTFKILLSKPKKELVIQVYDKTVAKRVINLVKAFNLDLRPFKARGVSEKNFYLKVNKNLIAEAYKSINNSELTDELLGELFKGDKHFNGNSLFLGYFFIIKPKNIFRSVVADKIVIATQLLSNKEFVKKVIETLKTLRKDFSNNNISINELKEVLRTRKDGGLSMIDLWLYSRLKDNKDLNNRLKVSRLLNDSSNRVIGLLSTMINSFKNYI